VFLTIAEFKTPGVGNEKRKERTVGERKKQGNVKGGWREKGTAGEGMQEC
jgi:hypothetical protein